MKKQSLLDRYDLTSFVILLIFVILGGLATC